MKAKLRPLQDMKWRLKSKFGANDNGIIKAIYIYTLSNAGAFGEHGPTTVGLSGHKLNTLYSGKMEAYKFDYDVVYTNTMSAGAYRGYGATQGTFAVESAVNELAAKLNIDPVKIRDKNMILRGRLCLHIIMSKQIVVL